MQQNQLSEFYSLITDELDISDTLFDKAVISYNAVGEYIDNHLDYNADIYPQGSFALGTVIRPISDDEDYDIDLVCDITANKILTAEETKICIGDVLIESKRYSQMLSEKKRCWRIDYADDAQFHMDITPAISLSSSHTVKVTTKNDTGVYSFSISNPRGYAEWFSKRKILTKDAFNIDERVQANIQEVERFGQKKPLQKIVQILKRHRDIMFIENVDDAPISIIITTLAAHAYNGTQDLYEALEEVLTGMETYIQYENGEYFVQNPTVDGENFAEKWNAEPQKVTAFYSWLGKAKTDLLISDRRIDNLDSYEYVLGEAVTSRAIGTLEGKATVLPEKASTDIILALPAVKNALLVSHRQKPQFHTPRGIGLIIHAKVTTGEGEQPYPYKSNGEPIPKGSIITFNFMGATNIVKKNNYSVKWQVTNTGVEAEEDNQLRGDFYTEINKTSRDEPAKYKGIHYVQAFLIYKKCCVAKSNPFIVNIQ